MNAIVISSDSPTFKCQSPACYIDAESIDTSYVYDNEYASTCSVNPLITVGGGTDGTDGIDGQDGRGIVSIVRTSGDGSPGTTDTYTITYTDATISTFNVYNGDDGSDGAVGATGTAATITVGTTTTGDAGTNASVVNSGTSSAAIFDFTIPRGADGSTLTVSSSIPTGGNNGDMHIYTVNYDLYEKSSGVWSVVGNVKGDTGTVGSDGSDGTDGDQWSYGSTVPSSSTVNTYDEYYIYTVNDDVYLKSAGAGTWSVVMNIAGSKYATTSSTSANLSTMSLDDTVVLTVADDDMAYTGGQYLVVAYTTDSTNQFTGIVTSYSSTTLNLIVKGISGSGTYTSWDVNLSGKIDSTSDFEHNDLSTIQGGSTNEYYHLSLSQYNTLTYSDSSVDNASSLHTHDYDSLLNKPTLGSGTITSVTAGNGMDFTDITATGSVIMGTPSTLTSSTTDAVTSVSHTHAIITGIADTNIVRVDHASAADNDYAKFTLNGLEGRSYSEVKTDLNLDNVENTALSTWTGTSNITTLGTISTGTWQGTTITVDQGGTGQTTQQAAIDALTNVSSATNEYVLTKDTSTGNAIWKASSGSGASFPYIVDDVSTNIDVEIAEFGRSTSGTAANNIGGFLSLSVENATGEQIPLELGHKLISVTDGSEQSRFYVKGQISGTIGNLMLINSTGNVLIGPSASTGSSDSIAIGESANSNADGSISIGKSTNATSQGAILMGYHTSLQTNSLTDSFKLMWDGVTGFHVGNTLGTQVTVNSDPDTNLTDAANGVIAYDSTDHEFRIYINGTWRGLAGGGTGTVTTVSAGNGLDFTDITVTGSVVLGTPSSVTSSSINNVTATSHTHALDNSGVISGSYTNANITVDSKGRVTAASNGSSSGITIGTDDQIPYCNSAGNDFDYSNNFKYDGSGLALDDGNNNVFIGLNVGSFATGMSYENTVVGYNAGSSLTSGGENTIFGDSAGSSLTTSTGNTFLGTEAGSNATGNNNVFIGFNSGANETGSNKLYIDNSNTTTPLIYGDFIDDELTINGTLEVTEGVKGVINVVKAQILYTNTTQTTIVTLPVDAVLWNIGIELITEFNGSGTDLLDVGIGGDTDKYIVDYNLSPGSLLFTVNNLRDWNYTNDAEKFSSSTNITFQYTDQNNDATQGEAYVYLYYSLH